MEMYTFVGSNTSGELGTRNDNAIMSFEKAKTKEEDLGSIISIGRASGKGANINVSAIHESGRVYATGSNTNGQLGDGSRQNSNYFKEMMYKTADYEEKIKLHIGETFNLTDESFKLNKN